MLFLSFYCNTLMYFLWCIPQCNVFLSMHSAVRRISHEVYWHFISSFLVNIILLCIYMEHTELKQKISSIEHSSTIIKLNSAKIWDFFLKWLLHFIKKFQIISNLISTQKNYKFELYFNMWKFSCSVIECIYFRNIDTWNR